ncbi:SdpI family protein [Microbacterium sp. SSW1-59]|uniref:SdpI family protein n=1 Tax=Microbacterium xanthum TaxID=3079794 RepID=UPI002AD5215A|nr:SdpI family protein [Microbacterium sp. SSW1-59]MDZ8201325.1 SdpI family protein [Microbacterium sp. SSW1-59]
MLLITGIVLVPAGLLMLWVAWASRRDRLRRNGAVGVRTPLTMESDAAWFAAQRAAASATAIGGWGALLGGIGAIVMAIVETSRPGLSFPFAMATWTLLALGAAGWSLAWTLIGAGRGTRAAEALCAAPATCA